MKKIVAILVLLVALVILSSGCITMEVDYKLNADGTGSASILMDMTKMRAFVESMYGSADPAEAQAALAEMDANYSKANICANLMKSLDTGDSSVSMTPGMDPKDFKCEAIADYKARFYSDNIDFKEAGLVTIDDAKKTMTFTVKQSQESGDANMADVQLQQAKMFGVEMTMTVEMPGPIASSATASGESVGEISEDKKKVVIDLLEDADKVTGGITIISSIAGAGLDMGAIQQYLPIIAIIVVIIIIVAAGVVVMKRKKGPPAAPPAAP